jgi:hypothetical protein
MNEYTVSRVSPDYLYMIWKDVRKLLKPAIKASGGRWRNEYVFAALVTQKQALWVVTVNDSLPIAAFTTEIINYPEKRAVAVHFLGGEWFDEWYPKWLEAVTEYGKQCNCEIIESNARFGFWKWLKQDGFTQKSVFYEKTI